jgi:hypothetical protein
MLENIKRIQNPLTIIALFAGLAEIASTAAMASVDTDLKHIFVWFVMGFSTLLVLLFFATLNFNAAVLYAPSDFRSDKTFLDLLLARIGKPAKRALNARSAYERLRAAAIGAAPAKVARVAKTLKKILVAAGYQPDANASAADLLGTFREALSDADPDVDLAGEKLRVLNAVVAAADLDQYGDIS